MIVAGVLAEIQAKTLAYARGSHFEKNAIIIDHGRERVPYSVVATFAH